MVLRGAEERPINGPANELGYDIIVAAHMVQLVRFTFEPEGVELFDVVGNVVDGRLGGTVHNVFVIRSRDRTHTKLEEPGEEVIPGFKSTILHGRFTYVFLYKINHGGTRTRTKASVCVSDEDVARL